MNHRSNIFSLLVRTVLGSLTALMFLASTVQAQTVTPASGGSGISADSSGGTYRSLTGPVYSEGASGNAGTGTIILNVPSGFVFDTGTPSPTVLITRIGGSGNNSRNINGVASGTSVAVTSMTTTQITLTVTSVSNSGVTNSLTWQNIRVRPSAGTPLASGNITKSGTSTMSGVTGATNFGTLTEVAGAIKKLVVTMPGQTFVAGTGNTGSTNALTAGTSFSITRITATDQFFNIVTSYTGAKTLAYSGPGGITSYVTAVTFASGQSSTTLTTTLHKAETTTISVSDGTTTGPASSSFIVNPGSLAKLQILVPGETADPGTATGKTGSPSTQTAGISFNVTVRGVDADWNLVSTTHTVHLTSSDANAALPADAALVAGSQTFSIILKTAGSRTVTASDVTNGAITSNTSPSITVNPGSITKLQLLVPGETAAPGTLAGKTGSPTATTAGNSFNVTVKTVDAYWNQVTSTDVVSLTSSDSYASLPANTALSGGSLTLSVTLKTAGSSTLIASDVTNPGYTSNTSPSIVVNAGSISKLQTLVPGESAVPGSPTGKSGTPDLQNAGSGFVVTVNAVDAQWNPVPSTDVVHLTSSDGGASLPSDAALVAGSRNFTVTLNTAGSQAVTASDVTVPAITSSVSSSITVNPAGTGTLTPATEGDSISADGYGGTYTTLTGPVYEEASNGNISIGSIILNVPSGFVFDTGGTAPSLLVVRLSGSGPNSNNINGKASGDTIGVTSVSTTQIRFDITNPSAGGVKNSITWQNVRVRPSAGYPLATGNLTKSGTSTIAGVNGSTNFGTLTEVPGAHAKLVITLPGQTFSEGSGNSSSPTSQTAGVSFTISAIRATDQFFNVVTSYSGAKTLSYSGPGGETSYTTNVSFTSGVSVTTLTTTLKRAEITTLSVSDGSVSGPASSSLTVSPATFTKLQLLVPGESANAGTTTGKTGSPSARTAGTSFSVTVRAVDNYWNLVSSTDNIGITSSDIYATLPSNNTLVAGSQTFSVTLRTAGTATITATDLTNGTNSPNTSPSITVNPGAFVKLQLIVPGETAVPGSPTGKTGTPSVEAAGAPFLVDVNAVDANWNIVSSSDLVHFTSSDGAAGLPADGALVNGTKSFSVTLNTVGSQTITVSDQTNGTITSNTSPSISVANVTITAATGGSAISADNTGGSFTSLTGPLYGEAASGQVGAGTIILNVPPGFEFDTGGTQPTVLITRLNGAGNNSRNINGVASGTSAATTVSSTQITFTVTSVSNSGVTCSLTWQNIRVRPTSGTPLASDDITKSGTSVMTGVTNGITNFGTLTEVPGAAVHLVVTLPGQTFVEGTGNTGSADNQTSGTSFNITRISATDQFYNIVTSYSGSKTINYSGPSGSTSYTTAVTFASGQSSTTLVTTLNAVETTTITANDGSISGPASSLLTVVAPTKIWTGGGTTSNWSDAANWSPVGVPGSLNDVQLTSAVTINVDIAANAKNLTLNNSSLVLTIQTGNSISVAGNLLIQAGNLRTEESFPTVSGTTSITGGTVSYTRTSGSQTISPQAYYNLVASGGTKTLGGNGTVQGDFTITSGTFDLGSSSLNRTLPGGTLTLASGATLLVGGSTGGITGSNFPANFGTSLGGTVNFNLAGNQTVPALTYNDVVLSNSGTKTIGPGTMTVVGTISTTGGATIDATTNASTMTFTGASGTIIPSMTYYNLSITATVPMSAAGDITVSHNFSNASTLAMDTYGLTISGTKTNSGIIQFAGGTNGVPFANGIVEYNGTVAQTVTAGTYANLIFTNSGVKTINSSVTANGLVTVNSGATLTVAVSSVLTINGDLENSGIINNAGTIALP